MYTGVHKSLTQVPAEHGRTIKTGHAEKMASS